MKAFWSYTLMRIGLFLATAAVVWGIYALVADTINLLVVLLVAAVISSVLSWKLLAGPRERLAANVDERAARAAARFDEVRAKEDQPEDGAVGPDDRDGEATGARSAERSADRQADQ